MVVYNVLHSMVTCIYAEKRLLIRLHIRAGLIGRFIYISMRKTANNNEGMGR